VLVRLCKIGIVAAIAFFFTLVAIGNVTDYGTNRAFVQHVMAMDTIFPDSTLHARAITDPAIQRAVYALIIATEAAAAALIWIGAIRLLLALRGDFRRAKDVAAAGLTLGFLLYAVGFVGIAAEWFAMWQSRQWNAQATALGFSALIALVLIVLLMPETEA
jgi:predicted small integral membrane protein